MDGVVTATEDLTKRHGETTVVDRVSLQVGREEVYDLLRPNGTRKTS